MLKSLFIHKFYNRIKSFQNPFYNKYPVTGSPFGLSCIPFFIIGSGRSGNTLLRSILSGNSDISIPPESYRIPFAIKKFHIFNNRDWSEVVSVVLDEFRNEKEFVHWEIDIENVQNKLENIPDTKKTLANIFDELYCTYSKQHSTGKIWGDKTPMNTSYLGWIGSVFPKSKFIHIIRDGRDVVSSYLKMGRYTTVKDAAQRWKKSVKFGKSFGSSIGNNYMEIRYEAMVSSPEEVIKNICSFLGITYSIEMLNHTNLVEKLGDTSLSHHSNLSRPITTDSIGKWKENLSSADKNEVLKLLKEDLMTLGYYD